MVFAKLERTSSSSSMIEILARFLPKLSPQQIRIAAYLLSGKVGPSFSTPEFGMAEKLVTRAVSLAFGVPLAHIMRLAVKSGDMGAVAEQFAETRGKSLQIADVFDFLTQIANTTGSGAQKSKIRKLAALLQRATAEEAKYIVRTVLGIHRIGVAEATFLRGLSKAFGGSKKETIDLDRAYNILSDLGEVAFRAAHSGLRSLGRVEPKLGVPIRMMLATRVEDLAEVPLHLKGEMFVEYKYDGERAQIHKDSGGDMRIFSRRLEDITYQYPEVIAHAQKGLKARTAIIEGEVVAVDRKTKMLLPFQIVMKRKRKHEIKRYQKEVPVAIFLFDILYLNGRNVLSTPLSDRKRLLKEHMKVDSVVNIGTFIRTQKITDAERYFNEATSRGAEGVVIKAALSPYQAGHRGWGWIKFKKEYKRELADTFDVVIVGALHGRGSRAGSYGSVLAAAFDPKTNKYYSFTKVGAGLTERLVTDLPGMLKPYVIPRKHRLVETSMEMDVWFEPAKVIEISGADLTISPVHTVARDKVKKGGIALRFPRLLRLRDDKTAQQATSVQELWEMYQQRKKSARAAKHVSRGANVTES